MASFVPPLEELEAGLADRMARCRVPGVGLALIVDGEVALERGYGVMEAEKPEPVTATTRFQACSISKPVAVLGMLRLVERGVLDLDADVNDVLTSWRVPPNASWQPRVTLRQIASHTAGLTVSGFPGYAAGAPIPTLPQILAGSAPANTAGVRVDTLPGLQFRYSGGGTTVLQLVVEEVTRRPFPDLMRELVLEPLGMHASDYAQPLSKDLQAEAATAHGGDGMGLAGRRHVYPELAAAGLWTTPGDLARYALGVQRAAASGSDALLGADLSTAMLSRQVRSSARMGGLDSIGLGLFVGGEPEPTLFGHSGGNEGFRCHLLAHRAAGWGVVVMTNGDRGNVLVQEILNVLGRTLDWRDYEASAPPELLPDDDLSLLVGTYEGEEPGIAVAVFRAGSGLDAELTGQPVTRFVRVSETEFGSFAVDATLRFDLAGEDPPATLVVHQNGEDLVFRRRTDPVGPGAVREVA